MGNGNGATPTIFIIDDDQVVRELLVSIFEAELLATRSFSSAEAFLEAADEPGRGCVITDIRMPGMDGVELLEEMKRRGSTRPVIVITAHADVPIAVRAMKAGAADFIEKPFRPAAIVEAARAALDRASLDHDRDRVRAAAQSRLGGLSSREREVLAFLVEGLSNKHIAAKLTISPRTVEIHRANVMHKSRSASLSELVRLALTIEAA